MTPLEALLELLARVGACQGGTVQVNAEELSQWPGEAVAAMKAQKLLLKARPATTAVCQGCERDCTMPVHTLTTAAGVPSSFIVCDKRSDTNRVPAPSERLIQWRCDAPAVCGFVAENLGLRHTVKSERDGLWEIGITTGNKRSQMLCLDASGVLTLVIGTNKVPLVDLVDFHEGQFSLDEAMIRRMVDAETTADPRHTPTIVKREARKLGTQTIYEGWQKKYRELKRKKPGMGGIWYSQQIAKNKPLNPLGRSAETIRKHIKM